VYGDLRVAQMQAHEVLFNELDLTVLAPSEAALDVWKASVSVVAPAIVHEHLKLDYEPSQPKKVADRGPLRVAYVGQPVAHKGWPVFKELTLRFGEDARYEFFHVGKGPQGIPGTFKEVAVGADDLDKMVRTLRELEIDVAVIWSLWPETFCIAAVEALRAGAAVLAFKDSGNVAAIVRKTGFGAVLDSEEELARLFETGDVVELAANVRPTGLTAEFSDMTADFIEEQAA
jgi:glycosyltransferase involved in cell wall biosynthesis